MSSEASLHRILYEDGELKLANLVTLSRGLLIAPILGLLAAQQGRVALALYLVAIATDVVDGWLARRSGRASTYGAQLDAAVDNLFSIAILAFLLLAYPGLGQRQLLALVVLFGAPVLYLAVSWALRRRLMMFHVWSAKAGAFLLFVLWPLMALTGWEGWVAVAALVVGASRLEQVVFLLRGGVDLNAPHGFVTVLRDPERSRP
jgi:phosphatidylglycerophosphate synthase